MKLRILVVDDEPAVLYLTAAVLEREDLDVVTAASAEEAIQHLGQEEFDLVLTDFRMPGESGEAVVLAARGQRPDYPVIVMTGRIHDMPAWLKEGPAAVRIVPKPFTVSDLCQTVNEALSRNDVVECRAGSPDPAF
jgi:DNA-binding NtrC family response regulator